MKVSTQNSRDEREGKHNDRNFNLEYAKHINPELTKNNKLYTYNGVYDTTFRDIEMEFYEQNFGESLAKQNERNTQARHPERNKTMEQYYKGVYTRPEGKILEIGNKYEHPDADVLWECALEYKDRFNQLFGDNCVILDMALHVDEEDSAPHVQIRRVWMAKDEETGLKSVSQEKALAQLDILPPNPSEPVSRMNNAKMTFTSIERTLFQQICIEKGLDIETDIDINNRTHYKIAELKRKTLLNEIDSIQRERDSISSELKEIKDERKELYDNVDDIISIIESDAAFMAMYREELEEAKKKGKAELFKTYTKLYSDELKNRARENVDIDNGFARLVAVRRDKRVKDFIRDKGLMEEYKEYSKQRSIKERNETHTL